MDKELAALYNNNNIRFLCFNYLQPIVIVAAVAFAGVSFYFLSPDVLDTEFCCNGDHNVEGVENEAIQGTLCYIKFKVHSLA